MGIGTYPPGRRGYIYREVKRTMLRLTGQETSELNSACYMTLNGRQNCASYRVIRSQLEVFFLLQVPGTYLSSRYACMDINETSNC
jgi:hypothetical protein